MNGPDTSSSLLLTLSGDMVTYLFSVGVMQPVADFVITSWSSLENDIDHDL